MGQVVNIEKLLENEKNNDSKNPPSSTGVVETKNFAVRLPRNLSRYTNEENENICQRSKNLYDANQEKIISGLRKTNDSVLHTRKKMKTNLKESELNHIKLNNKQILINVGNGLFKLVNFKKNLKE